MQGGSFMSSYKIPPGDPSSREYLLNGDVANSDKSDAYLFPRDFSNAKKGPLQNPEKPSLALVSSDNPTRLRDDFPLFDKAPMKRSESSEQSGLTSED